MPKQCTYPFSRRILATPRSFIREILKVTERPDIISFAGGLPSPAFLDAAGVSAASESVLREDGCAALQYSTTEGYLPLREWIADRYHTRLGLRVDPGEILITHGSQQTLDLLGRIFLNEGDPVAIEAPGYLGAIQAFSQYMPRFCPVLMGSEGPDPSGIARVLEEDDPVFFYAIPNSQNPSGITCTPGRREEVAGLLADTGTLLVEDDAYGEIRFNGDHPPSYRSLLGDRALLLGSFSKIVAPGLRLGWLCAPEEVIEMAVTAKQASDLHSNILAQRVLCRYLAENDLNAHIAKITRAYAGQCSLMVRLMEELFPAEVKFTRPDGGMFIWLTLPEGASAMELYRKTLEEKVAILPGTPFYTDGGGDRGVRLNFSNSDEGKIRTGIARLAGVLENYL
ncbi:MAG: PLP-dependent aminotransferase family protein [Methanolinea sp.]|nr:PLP-dependent aminotransferase family protein [Methanolinea sp.]